MTNTLPLHSAQTAIKVCPWPSQISRYDIKQTNHYIGIGFDILYYLCGECFTTFCNECSQHHPEKHQHSIYTVTAKHWMHGQGESKECTKCHNTVHCRLECREEACPFALCDKCTTKEHLTEHYPRKGNQHHSLFAIRPPYWQVDSLATVAEQHCPCADSTLANCCVSHCGRCSKRKSPSPSFPSQQTNTI